ATTGAASGVSQTYRLPAGAGMLGQRSGPTSCSVMSSPSCAARPASSSRLATATSAAGWVSQASSRHRSGPMPAGSPGVRANGRGVVMTASLRCENAGVVYAQEKARRCRARSCVRPSEPDFDVGLVADLAQPGLQFLVVLAVAQ